MWTPKIAIYHLKRVYHFFKTGLAKGLVGQVRYRFPARKIKVIAITGTDGKTTTSTLLYHLLQKSGRKVALLSTVAAYVGDESIDTGFHVTNPDPLSNQKFLRQLVNQGFEYLVMEMTSHGAYQFRNWGIKPTLAGITNITHEHLDYHHTYQLYLEAKAMILTSAKKAFLNRDDDSYARLKKSIPTHKIETYSSEDRLPSSVKKAIVQRFPEQYNQLNARLAYALAGELGLTNAEFIEHCTTFAGVPGRMEWYQPKQKLPFSIVIDFAHTPNGLKSVLTALRKQLPKTGKLVAVYGSAGLRDYSKRPLMGQIGVELADMVVLTAEDPRTEDVWSILRQMKEQLTSGHQKVHSIADRQEAITFALTKLAKKGDIVALLGKAHEKSMCFGTTEYPWDEFKAVDTALNTQ